MIVFICQYSYFLTTMQVSSVNEVLVVFIFAYIVIFCSVSILDFMPQHRDAITGADC